MFQTAFRPTFYMKYRIIRNALSEAKGRLKQGFGLAKLRFRRPSMKRLAIFSIDDMAAMLFTGRQVFGTREMGGEFGFNQPPAQGIIRIVGRQRPNGVNMVRQHAYGDGFKGILFLHIHISRTRSRYVRQAGAISG